MHVSLRVERMGAWVSRFRSLNSDRSIIRKVIRGLLSTLSSVAEQTSTERGPPLVRHSAEARRERAKLSEARSVKVFPSKGLLSQPKVISSPSQRRRRRVSRARISENGARRRNGSFFPR